MTAKYTVLGNTTLTTASASVTFSSIPGGYKDLVLVVNAKGDTSNSALEPYFNGDTGANYPVVLMYSDGSASSFGQTFTKARMGVSSATTTEASMGILQVMDFSATDKHKSFLARSTERGTSAVTAVAGRWANTAAITSIDLSPTNGFAAGSTFRLLGVN